jgi:hypothetical protein
MPGVPTQGKTVKIPDLEGSVPLRGRPAPVVADATDVMPCFEGSCVNEDMPRPGDASGGEAPTPMLPRGPGSCPPEDAALGVVVLALGSSDVVDFGANELGLSGYPRVPPLSFSWRHAEGGAELACSRVAATC